LPNLPTTPGQLGSLSAAAEYYGVTPRTIRRWVAQGRLTAYRVGPRLLRVDLDATEQLVRQLRTSRAGR